MKAIEGVWFGTLTFIMRQSMFVWTEIVFAFDYCVAFGDRNWLLSFLQWVCIREWLKVSVVRDYKMAMQICTVALYVST